MGGRESGAAGRVGAPRGGLSPWALPLAWLVALAAFATVALQPLVNIDIAWHLLAAREWRRGAELYVGIRDPNLPAAWMLYRACWWLGDLLGLPAHRVFFALVALWGLACAWLTLRLLPAEGSARRAMAAVTLAGAAALFAGASLYQAGQRDHVIALALLPYGAWLCRLSLTEPPRHLRRLGALATLLALLALQLKPYGLCYLLAGEAWLAWRRRQPWAALRADLLAPLFAVGLLVALQLVAFPAYLQFLRDWAAYYANQGLTQPSARILITLGLLAAALLWLALRRPSAAAPARWGEVLVVLALGALLACAAQNKWWDYHAYPFELFTELAWVLLLWEAWRHPSWRGPRARALALLLAAAVSLWFAWIGLLALRQQKLMTLDRPPQSEVRALAAAIDEAAPGGRVAFFGGLDANLAVYFAEARWALPTPVLWVEGMLLGHRRDGLPLPDWLAAAAARHFDEVLARLEADPPALLGFYRGGAAAPEDFHGLYRADPRFAALLETHYRPWQDLADYALWRRLP